MLDLFAPRAAGRYPSLADRIDASGDCWEWLGFKDALGYGRAKSKATGEGMAHRIVWTYLVGPIPAGLTIDHLCRNTSCVNPDHLEPVPHAENVRRGVSGAVNGNRERSKTHCKWGHAFTPENTMLIPRGPGRTQRFCRTCSNARSNESHRRGMGRRK